MHDLEAMRVFSKVAELRSFARAAEALGIPRSSASAAVQKLEATLQTRLLHRTTRQVTLSQDGEVFYERCGALLAEFEELSSLFRRGGTALSGRIRVGMSSGLAQHVVVPALTELLDAHPDLKVELSSTERRVDVVREGFDCVVRVGDVVDESLVARRLGAMPIASCVSPAYAERHGVPKTPEEITGHRLVHYVPNFQGRDHFEYVDADGLHTVPLAGAVTVNGGEAYLAACLAGLGIVQIPRLAAQRFLQTGALVEILTNYPAESMPVAILYAERRYLPARVHTFIAWLTDVLSPHLERATGPTGFLAAAKPSSTLR